MATCPRCHATNPDNARFCSTCGSPLAGAGIPPLELRKTVTVLFCDLTGSTSLGEQQDPEQLRVVLTRYYEEARAVLERHGGRVEKFIGDAVMAVFGIPTLHEDDALRAVRSALELRTAFATLSDELDRSLGVRIEVRIGVNTGEVIAGDPSRGHPLVAGDAVNVAQRLEAAAPPGEILIGEETYRLSRQAVEVVAVEPLDVKGKREPVVAHQLVGVTPGTAALPRRLDSPMIGRERELTLLQEAFARSVREQSCHLFTILGPAGVGKSRLVTEALQQLAEGATMLSGACLPYGDGITFWPVLEIVKQATGLTEDDSPDEARRKIRAVLDDEPSAELIAERVAELVGFSEEAGTAEDGFWGVRRLFEALARRTPVVVVFDDVNWAEPTLLDLVEHVAGWAHDASLAVVCMARPELLDQRPGWGGGMRNTTTIFLEPLTEDESTQLIHNLLGQAALDAEVRRRIQDAAAGNPLFVEETLAMLIDEGLLERRDGHWSAAGDLSGFKVPRSIQVLLASRLDQLGDAERRALERGAVEGNVFHLGAVEALAPAEERAGVAASLSGLVRKELVRPHRPVFAEEEGFAFRHPLIREAAYDAVPKQVRGELHEGYAEWLAPRAGEYEELVGYHLEQAFRYRAELGAASDGDRELAERASGLLASAGRRALARGDVPAAVDLLGRAALLCQEEGGHVALLPELGAALRDAGELAVAEQVLEEAVEGARHSGDRRVELAATIERASLLLLRDPAQTDRLLAEIEAAVPELEEMGEDRVLAIAWTLLGVRFGVWRGRFVRGEEALERALLHARRAGDRRQEAHILMNLCLAAASGPTPVADAIRRCDEIRAEAHGDRLVEAGVARYVAMLEARRQRFEEARALAAQARATYEELGMQVMAQAASALAQGDIELLAGDYEAAERVLRTGGEALDRMGERGYQSSVSAFLSRALYGQGRLEEAEQVARRSQEEASEEDMWSQVLSSGTLAKVLARRGAFEEAEASARQAVRVVEETDAIDLHGGALLDRAEALLLADHRSYAESCAEQALELFGRKGNEVLAQQASALLERAGETTTA